MTPQERLALLLEYQKKQPELGSTLPAMNRAPTGAEPQQSWLDKLSDAASGAGYGLASQVEGIGQMARHPLDTLHSMAVGAGKAMDNPAAAGAAVVQGLKEAAGQAVSSPFNMGKAVGANVSLNPRKLAAMLESPMVREMTVYHGTPHQFPATEANPLGEFDASKIGTGEGAQAYGHGIYVAESPDVAKSYSLLNGVELKDSKGNAIKIAPEVEWVANDLFKAHGNYEKVRQLLVDHAKNYPWPAEMGLKHLEKWEKAGITPHTKGALYTVDLPDEHIERMLDWDKPLSEQSDYVKNAINKSEYALRDMAFDITGNSDPTGGQIAKTAMNSKEFSQHLRELGVPGIKYLDEGSRGNGSILKKFESKKEAQDFANKMGGSTQIQPRGESWVVVGEPKKTRNFVIFPGEEKNLKILERK